MRTEGVRGAAVSSSHLPESALMPRYPRFVICPVICAALVACSAGEVMDAPKEAPLVTSFAAGRLSALGRGSVKPSGRTAEVFVRGSTAYTTTWNNSGTTSAVYIWDVAGNTPVLVDSIAVDGARTLGDIAVSDDGTLLIVATESNGSLAIFSLANPRKPVLLTQYAEAPLRLGVHTAEIGRVGGTLYAFLAIDPGSGVGGQLVIVDLSNPASPRQVLSRHIASYIHDTFLRDGLLYLALWDEGMAIWDVGGGGQGGTVSAPVELSRIRTANGEVHNIWSFSDPATGLTKYAFVGEEAFGTVGVSSAGDVHVVDMSNPNLPREVALYTVAGAGTHNFSMDEPNGILYAAYYNGGVRALDVRGDLGTCTDVQRSSPAKGGAALCDLSRMNRELAVGLLDQGIPVYVWGIQYLNGAVYASDMINGIWKLRPATRP